MGLPLEFRTSILGALRLLFWPRVPFRGPGTVLEGHSECLEIR